MSLLLDALKKAELAKQLAKAGAEKTASAEPEAPVATREALRDVTPPLELMPDEPAYPEQGPAASSVRPELSFQQPDLAAAEPDALRYAAEAAGEAERAQARQLFEVKEMDYNPRRPFYISLAVLGLVGAGYAGYVWWETRPKYAAVASIPPASPPVAAVAPPPVPAMPPPSKEASVAPGAAPASPPPAPEAAKKVQEIPPIQPVRPPRTRRQTQRAAAAPAPRRPQSETAPMAAAELRTREARTAIAINAPASSVDPQIERAYQAFQRNDLAVARDGYQRVLSREPTSRDALLGLAAVSLRTGDLDSAESRYLRLLELDPRDIQAAANLIALHGQLDPVASESRLKTLIASQPEAAPLHFALGNQYAKQSRWIEAQEAYFKAYSVNPENADYAFNLAVSLDQLRQKKPALQYYQRALSLTERQAASFGRAQARTRVQELSK